MGYRRRLGVLGAAVCDRDDRPDADFADRLLTQAECLEQLLLAFTDIADRDDIHQAAARLEIVQAWIRDESERARADPVLAKSRTG